MKIFLKNAKSDLRTLFEKEITRAAETNNVEALAACITHAAKAGVSVNATNVVKENQETLWKVCQ